MEIDVWYQTLKSCFRRAQKENITENKATLNSLLGSIGRLINNFYEYIRVTNNETLKKNNEEAKVNEYFNDPEYKEMTDNLQRASINDKLIHNKMERMVRDYPFMLIFEYFLLGLF